MEGLAMISILLLHICHTCIFLFLNTKSKYCVKIKLIGSGVRLPGFKSQFF